MVVLGPTFVQIDGAEPADRLRVNGARRRRHPERVDRRDEDHARRRRRRRHPARRPRRRRPDRRRRLRRRQGRQGRRRRPHGRLLRPLHLEPGRRQRHGRRRRRAATRMFFLGSQRRRDVRLRPQRRPAAPRRATSGTSSWTSTRRGRSTRSPAAARTCFARRRPAPHRRRADRRQPRARLPITAGGDDAPTGSRSRAPTATTPSRSPARVVVGGAATVTGLPVKLGSRHSDGAARHAGDRHAAAATTRVDTSGLAARRRSGWRWS